MSEPQSHALVPTSLVGGKFARKAPEERTAPPALDSESIQDGGADPANVPPTVPLLITNEGDVPVHVVLVGGQAVEGIHEQIVASSRAWATEHGRELSDMVITWSVKLQAVARTPTLVMPDQD